MPELPDLTVYQEAIEARIAGQTLNQIRISNPFLLRTVDPSPAELAGRKVVAMKRLGKRLAIGVEEDDWIVLHLMIAGRLHWKPGPAESARIPAKYGLAALDFSSGTLILTEAGSKRRASLHIIRGQTAVDQLNPGGLEPLQCSLKQFVTSLTAENHTLKRSLTDPHRFSGIGNAYSDEILHRAQLSPIQQTQKLTEQEVKRLFHATQETLQSWIDRLRLEAGTSFPEGVTAFRDGMAVHGRFGQPCPVCEAPIQRIRYADNETNYCPRCQTGGQVLADRSLSRLLKQDWPRSIDAWT